VASEHDRFVIVAGVLRPSFSSCDDSVQSHRANERVGYTAKPLRA